MTKTLRLGLIGCGIQGTVLAQALSQVENAKLHSVVDIREEVAREFKTKFGAEEYFLNHNDMISREDIDAVIMAVPHSLLSGITIDTIQQNKHVFVEKPMATDPVEAQKIVNDAEKAGVNLMVGYCLRYDSARMKLKQVIDSGALGEIRLIIAAKGSPPFNTIWPELRWLMRKETGGGILMFLGVHMIDQVLWMAGSEVEEVFGEVNQMPDFDVDGTDTFTLRFKNGLLANACCSMQVSGGVEGNLDQIEVIGDKGAARADWVLGDSILRIHSKVDKEYSEPTMIRFQTRGQFTHIYVKELQEFVNSILEDRTPAITGEDGLNVLKVTDAVFRSSNEHKPIVLK